jgi:hypothetical protein
MHHIQEQYQFLTMHIFDRFKPEIGGFAHERYRSERPPSFKSRLVTRTKSIVSW